MKTFVVIGLGRFGSSIAATLYELGNEVLAIDRDDEIVQDFSGAVTHAVTADASEALTLKSLGIRNFDCAVVAVGGSMEDSILVTMQLKEMGVPYVVSKAKNELHAKVLERIGADNVILPERDMGQRVAKNLSLSNVIDFLQLSPDYSIVELPAPKAWYDKSFLQLHIRAHYNVNVIAIKREDKFIPSPGGDDLVLKDDILITLGKNSALHALERMK